MRFVDCCALLLLWQVVRVVNWYVDNVYQPRQCSTAQCGAAWTLANGGPACCHQCHRVHGGSCNGSCMCGSWFLWCCCGKLLVLLWLLQSGSCSRSVVRLLQVWILVSVVLMWEVVLCEVVLPQRCLRGMQIHCRRGDSGSLHSAVLGTQTRMLATNNTQPRCSRCSNPRRCGSSAPIQEGVFPQRRSAVKACDQIEMFRCKHLRAHLCWSQKVVR